MGKKISKFGRNFSFVPEMELRSRSDRKAFKTIQQSRGPRVRKYVEVQCSRKQIDWKTKKLGKNCRLHNDLFWDQFRKHLWMSGHPWSGYRNLEDCVQTLTGKRCCCSDRVGRLHSGIAVRPCFCQLDNHDRWFNCANQSECNRSSWSYRIFTNFLLSRQRESRCYFWAFFRGTIPVFSGFRDKREGADLLAARLVEGSIQFAICGLYQCLARSVGFARALICAVFLKFL